jgi:hypothetical protein
MADTAYERYRKDVTTQKKKKNIENYTDFQKALLHAVEKQTAPKKPVKWWKADVGALTLATTLSPTLRAQSWFTEFKDNEGKVIKPKYVNLNKWIREYSGQKEKDYISGLDELAKGVEQGIWQLSGGINQLITIPTDLVTGAVGWAAGNPDIGTNFTEALEKSMNDEKIKPDEPETWRGELTSLGVQFGIPYTTILKLVNRANALAPVYKFLRINKATKTSKIYRRAVEGAALLGATDFIVSSPGRHVLNPLPGFQPVSTEGLTGSKKAAAEFKNKVKYGFEGIVVGGGFPLVGKGIQLGYKWLGPKWAAKKAAQIGLRTANKVVFEPASYIFSTPRFSPAHLLPKKLAKKMPGLEKSLGKHTLYNPINPTWQWASKAIRGMTNWTLTKAIAPTIATGLSPLVKDPVTGKRVFKRLGWLGAKWAPVRGEKIWKPKKVWEVNQLPPFEQWRLGSVTSRDITERSAKTLDNFISWFRSYGKMPVSIEGASEKAMLYGRSVARKFDRAFAGLEKEAYALAKGFEGQYNKATTSPAMQKYWLDQVDEYIFNQRILNDLPKELQGLSKQVKETLEEVVARFRSALPKGKKADEYVNALRDDLGKKTHSYLLRSFSTFTNPYHAVEPKIRENAVNWIAKNVIAKNKNLREQSLKDFPNDTGFKNAANDMVDSILATGKTEGKDPLVILKFISQKIMQGKQYKFLKTGEELPKAIRALLGQERNVKFSVLDTGMSVVNQNMAKVAADHMAKQGLKDGWLFTSEAAARSKYIMPAQIQRVPRMGDYLKTDLEGLWTSPEFQQMFMGLGTPFANLVKSSWYRHIIQGKAAVQIGKTLYSPTTQVRNVTSASMFALNAGHIGWRASVTDSWRMVIRDVFKEGKGVDEVAFNNMVSKLVRLGVYDENIVATEMKIVLEELKSGKINTFDKLFERMMKMAQSDKVGRIYAGGDNLWKFYGFNFDRSMLLEALHNIDDVAKFMSHMGVPFSKTNLISGAKLTLDDALDEAAAYLIRNSYPTYSKVPPVIQALRKFPLGNFVSFPAEMMRTTTTNIAMGLKMSSHPNMVIRQMGLRRLMGSFFTLYGLGKGISEVSQFLTNTTESQEDAYKRSFAASWNRNADLIMLKGWEDGESLAINFTYFMPYDVMQRPLEAAITAAHAQNINPKDVNAYVLGLVFSPEGPFMEILEPFVSQPLGYDRLVDVTVGGGRKPRGGRVYTRLELENDLPAVFNKSFAYIIEGLKPGVVITSEKISAGLRKDLTKGGKPVNTMDELLALFSGIRLIRIDTKSDLKYYAATLNSAMRDIDEASDFYSTKGWQQKTPTELIEDFDKQQKKAFRIQKDMFIRIEDMKLLNVNNRTIRKILQNAQVNDVLINNLMRGRFTPSPYSNPRFKQKVEYIKEAFKELEEEGEYFYDFNKKWAFPKRKLDAVKRDWTRRKFFPEGYTPDTTKYKKDSSGRTLYNKDGSPIIDEEPGIIKKGLEKIKKLVNPLAGLTSQKPQVPPLPNTPMPNVATAALQKSPQTGLTRSETALLSPSEQEIARRT